MPAHRGRATLARSRPARRKVIWAQQAFTQAFTANSQWATLDLLLSFKATAGAQVTKATVMRTHLVVVPQVMASGDTWYVGVKLFDADDITGATTSNTMIPNPRDNPYVDWALSTQIITDNGLFANPGGSPGLHGTQSFAIDLKSKRRMDNIQQTWGICVLQDSVTTVAKSYKIFSRTLLALA